MYTTSPAKIDLRGVILEETRRAIEGNRARVAFQWFRLAPEALLVHLIGYELQHRLDSLRTDTYCVRFEHRDRFDIAIDRCAINGSLVTDFETLAVIEMKVAWSRWPGEDAILSDAKKIGRSQYGGFIVVAFMNVDHDEDWSHKSGGTMDFAEWVTRVESKLRSGVDSLTCDLVNPGERGIVLRSGVECTIAVWQIRKDS